MNSWIITAALFSLSAPPADHWSFRVPRRPELPAVNHLDWCRNSLDCFVLARLQKEGIQPSAEADRSTLLRRLCLDLTGLPPSVRQLREFLSDNSPDAYEKLVDRLLGSPAYGERWGRHWLDAARYADSDGYEKDLGRPNAWRWRDWVINALNLDLTFDRFTIEQLAGDLLPNATLDQKTATGFHRNTLTNREGGADQEQFRVEATVDRTNTTMSVWMGATFGCAQCHNHKYDPFSQKEYYQIFAFFNNADEYDIPLGPKPEAKKGEKTAPPPMVPTLRESKGRKTHVMIRGDFLRSGEPVNVDVPGVFNPTRQYKFRNRLDFARWLVEPANPLTARVRVNWVWQKFFGRGLVVTAEDFGTQGAPPSHPELLDWLAIEFLNQQWSLKALHRLIVCSATYRQSSHQQSALRDRDPLNLLLARQVRLRLEAEVVRDHALAVSGLLTRRIGGPSARPPQPAGIAELTYADSANWQESKGPDRYRRGLYIWFQRTSPFPALMTFDAPESTVCIVRREKSNTPLQALTLMNDVAFVECATAFGARLQADSESTTGRLSSAWLACFAHEPTGDEMRRLNLLHDQLRQLFANDAEGEKRTWQALARMLLNLDEFVTRE